MAHSLALWAISVRQDTPCAVGNCLDGRREALPCTVGNTGVAGHSLALGNCLDGCRGTVAHSLALGNCLDGRREALPCTVGNTGVAGHSLGLWATVWTGAAEHSLGLWAISVRGTVAHSLALGNCLDGCHGAAVRGVDRRKVKGTATLEYKIDGKNEEMEAELHWYEAPNIGKVKVKIKF